MSHLVKIIGIVFICLLLSPQKSNAQETVKARKLNFKDFQDDYSINDTSSAIIDLFFGKKDYTAYGQITLLPITTGLVFFPPTSILGIGLSAVSVPLFFNGLRVLHKYRKKKLLEVLLVYKKTGLLPPKIRKQTNRLLFYYEMIEQAAEDEKKSNL